MSIRDLVPTWFQRNNKLAVRREPESAVASLQHEVNRLFDGFWRDLEVGPMARFSRWGLADVTGWAPRLDVAETDKHVEVTAEVPGMSENDIDVCLSADGTYLTLKGEKRGERERTEGETTWVERSFGSFHRTVALPARATDNGVEATIKNGVLRVRLAKVASTNRKQIKVKTA